MHIEKKVHQSLRLVNNEIYYFQIKKWVGLVVNLRQMPQQLLICQNTQQVLILNNMIALSRVHNNHTYSRRLSALRKLQFSSIKINPLNLESQTKLRTNPGFPEFPIQNLMQTGFVKGFLSYDRTSKQTEITTYIDDIHNSQLGK